MAKIDTSRWKEFIVGELFSISRPIARSQAKYEDGDVAFVARETLIMGCPSGVHPRLMKF